MEQVGAPSAALGWGRPSPPAHSPELSVCILLAPARTSHGDCTEPGQVWAPGLPRGVLWYLFLAEWTSERTSGRMCIGERSL